MLISNVFGYFSIWNIHRQLLQSTVRDMTPHRTCSCRPSCGNVQRKKSSLETTNGVADLKSRITLLISGIVIVTILAGCEFIVQTVAPTPTLVAAGSSKQRPMVDVELGLLEEAIKVTGRIEAEERQDLFFRAPGRIKNVTVRNGDVVTEGQVLAELETGGLESQVADAEKTLETAELRVLSSEASLAQDRENARNAVVKSKNDIAAKQQALASGHSNARSALIAATNDLADKEEKLNSLLSGGTAEQIAAAKAAVAAANSSHVNSSTDLALMEASSSQTLSVVKAVVATRQATVTIAAQSLENLKSRGAPSIAEARVDGERRLEKLEADVSTTRSSFYQSEADLVDVLNQPTAGQKLDAKNAYDKAKLDYDAAISGSGSDEAKEKAGIVWQEAQRTYNDALLPATDAEVVAARANVATTRRALLTIEQELAETLGSGSRAQAIDALAAAFRNEYSEDLAVAESALANANTDLAEAKYELGRVEAGLGTSAEQRARASTEAALENLEKAQSSLLALTNPSDSDIAAARNAIEVSRITLSNAEGTLNEFEAGESPQDFDLVILRNNLESALDTLKRYDAGESAKDYDLTILRNNLEQAKIKLTRLQEQTFENQVVAPFGGEITFVRGKPGDQVAAYQEIIGLANPERLIVEAIVPEVDQPSMSVGQPTELTIDAFPGVVFDGRVASLPRNIISSTGQTVKIPETIIDGDFSREGMDIGMLVRLKIVVQIKDDVMKVPLTAVRTVNNRDFVETIIDGQRRSLPVTVGIRSDTEIEILDGLEAGQQIYASP